jgi:hypothetical protein
MIRLSVLVSLAALLLAACGSGADDHASDPSSTPAGEPTIIGVYSATAAGGAGVGPVVDVGHFQGQTDLLGLIRGPLRAEVMSAITDTEIPDGQRLVGGIVAIGCGTPSSAELVDKGNGLTFAPVWKVKPPQECFAAVTSIALALLPDGWSGSTGG